MGSTRRSPLCSRSRTTGVLAGSSNRTPRSSISTTSSTLPPALAPLAPVAAGSRTPPRALTVGLPGAVEGGHEGVRVGPQGGQVGGGHEVQVPVALLVVEAVAHHVVLVHGEADPPQRDGHHPPPDL